VEGPNLPQTTDPEKRNPSYVVAATAVIALTIAAATLAPVGDLPRVPGTDKWHHLIAFAALTFPAALFRPHLLVWVFPCAVLYGGLIEVVQPYVGRDLEFRDFLADAAGALIGIGLGCTLRAVFILRAIPVRTDQ
jgi:hypothetical protein